MRRIILLLAVATVAVLLDVGLARGSSLAQSQVHKGATGLTWLSNPDHAKFGTPKSRARAYWQARRTLMDGFRSAGFVPSVYCVHRGEGSWGETSNPKYDGGMQMDAPFQLTYGPQYLQRWGRAYNWPDWAQLHASFKAWTTRGWGPWPQTARNCGLL